MSGCPRARHRSGAPRGQDSRTACRAPPCSRSTRASRARRRPHWEEPSLVQVWGPRYSTYVIAAADRAVFTLGRLPDEGRARRRAEDMANRLDTFLAGRAMGDGEAGRGVGVPSERAPLRGADRPDPDPLGRGAAADDLDRATAGDRSGRRPPGARAHGTSTCSGRARPEAFAEWAGMSPAVARTAFAALGSSLVPVRTPDRRRLDPRRGRGDVPCPAAPQGAPARLLPSGDTFFLLQGADRELLVPDADRRAMLWTPRVWPGAVLVEGEVVGTWRRAQAVVTVEPWQEVHGDPTGRDRGGGRLDAAARFGGVDPAALAALMPLEFDPPRLKRTQDQSSRLCNALSWPTDRAGRSSQHACERGRRTTEHGRAVDAVARRDAGGGARRAPGRDRSASRGPGRSGRAGVGSDRPDGREGCRRRGARCAERTKGGRAGRRARRREPRATPARRGRRARRQLERPRRRRAAASTMRNGRPTTVKDCLASTYHLVHDSRRGSAPRSRRQPAITPRTLKRHARPTAKRGHRSSTGLSSRSRDLPGST